MSLMRTKFQRDLFPGIDIRIMNAHKEKEAQFAKLFRVKDSSSAFEEVRSAAGLGLFGRQQEGISSILDSFKDGFAKRYNHEEYSLAIGMSHRFMKDIKTPELIRDRGMDLGRSARSSQEQAISAMLNLAFDSAQLTPDGKTLCATDHINIKSGTQSNIISPVSTINVVGARLMLTKFRRFKDDTGVRKISLDPEWIVVPPEEQFNAEEVFKSTDRPDTANRATNVISNKVKVMTYDYLEPDINNWFMLSAKSQHFLIVYMRERFSTREYEDEKTKMVYIEGAYMLSFGPAHWLGVVGSNPA